MTESRGRGESDGLGAASLNSHGQAFLQLLDARVALLS